MNENVQLGNKKGKEEENSNCNPPFDKMSTECPWERYSTMTVQKNSGFQWSGNFSQPPSAIGDEDLNTQDLISEQNAGNKKEQLQHNQNKHSTVS